MSELYRQFHFRYCNNGHLIYSGSGPVTQNNCNKCGQPLLSNCGNCNAQIPSTFRSMVYLTNSQPIHFPRRPDFCVSCGQAYPWASLEELHNDRKDFWDIIHPSVEKAARKRLENGHYSDAVEAAMKALIVTVKTIYREKANEELDGVALMRKAFSPQRPTIILENQDSQIGRDIQQGYMDLFAGAIAGIRNPKAHDVIEIDEKRAIHHLFLASLLFYKLDERPK